MQKRINSNDIKFIFAITLKLLIISTVTALLLSCVNALTVDKIAENAAREKAAAIASIFPDASKNTQLDFALENMSGIYMVYSENDTLGYAAEVTPLGFGGKMSVMVGVNIDGTLAGVKLISHSETPGLGSRVGDGTYLSKYAGKDAKTLASEGVDVITGSTVSSNAIRSGVETALAAYNTLFPHGGAK